MAMPVELQFCLLSKQEMQAFLPVRFQNSPSGETGLHIAASSPLCRHNPLHHPRNAFGIDGNRIHAHRHQQGYQGRCIGQ